MNQDQEQNQEGNREPGPLLPLVPERDLEDRNFLPPLADLLLDAMEGFLEVGFVPPENDREDDRENQKTGTVPRRAGVPWREGEEALLHWRRAALIGVNTVLSEFREFLLRQQGKATPAGSVVDELVESITVENLNHKKELGWKLDAFSPRDESEEETQEESQSCNGSDGLTSGEG